MIMFDPVIGARLTDGLPRVNLMRSNLMSSRRTIATKNQRRAVRKFVLSAVRRFCAAIASAPSLREAHDETCSEVYRSEADIAASTFKLRKT